MANLDYHFLDLGGFKMLGIEHEAFVQIIVPFDIEGQHLRPPVPEYAPVS
jgi:hypothetical protein